MSNNLTDVEAIRRRVAAAAARAGRDPSQITIIAVSKTRTVAEIERVLAEGIAHLAENRVQEMAAKFPAIGRRATWHLIGSLQTNKVKVALEMADLIHSLDRASLAVELAKEAVRRTQPCKALVQVNVSGEETKQGVAPADLPGFMRMVDKLGTIEVQGLMTMAPQSDDQERARPHFRRLRELAEEVQQLGLANIQMRHLSMGMSGDFEAAVEEGATLVRIGTALFGQR